MSPPLGSYIPRPRPGGISRKKTQAEQPLVNLSTSYVQEDTSSLSTNLSLEERKKKRKKDILSFLTQTLESGNSGVKAARGFASAAPPRIWGEAVYPGHYRCVHPSSRFSPSTDRSGFSAPRSAHKT